MQRFWSNIRFWCTLALVTTFAMATIVTVNFFLVTPLEASSGLKPAYVTAMIVNDDGVLHWTVTIDKVKREITAVPAVAF